MSSTDTDQDSTWYRDGLSFECTRCGACCTGAPGYVWVIAEEIARLAAHRGETVDQFSKQYVRRVGQRYSLIEKPGGDCIFWDKAGRLHRLPRSTGPVPDLAILAREYRDARGLGGRQVGLSRLGARASGSASKQIQASAARVHS